MKCFCRWHGVPLSTKFYNEEDGWEQEQLARADIELLMWRVFAGDTARGVQTIEHTKGLIKR